MSVRVKLLNLLAKEFSYDSYLEIGCYMDATFKAVDVRVKCGVDPVRGGTVCMTSDEFFKTHRQIKRQLGYTVDCFRFDLIFIDGLHEREQVRRDIINALDVLSENGTIVLHDCLPKKKEHQLSIEEFKEHYGKEPPAGKPWNGDVWKTIAEVKTWAYPDLAVLQQDWGLGIIRPRPNETPLDGKHAVQCLQPEHLEWRHFAEISRTFNLLDDLDQAMAFAKDEG